jgi:hypothetical protein
VDIPPELVEAKAAVKLGLLSLPGVVGVGLGVREANEEFFDELAVRILVEDAGQVPAGVPPRSSVSRSASSSDTCVPLSLPHFDRYQPLCGGIA